MWNFPKELTPQIVFFTENLQQIGMIVAQWNARNLGVDIQKHVAIYINQIVSNWFIIIGKQLHRSRILSRSI